MRSPRPQMRTLAVTVAVAALVLSACTPEQFQAWWTGRGNPPPTEPQLSAVADVATGYRAEVGRRNRFAYQGPASTAPWRPA